MIVQYQNVFSHSIIADFYHVCNLTLFSFVYFLRIASTEKSYIFIKLDLKFEEKGCLFKSQNVFSHSIFAVFNHQLDLHCGQETQYEINGERLVRAVLVRIVSKELLTS